MSIKEKQTLIDLTDLTASSYIYWFTDGRQLQKPEVYILKFPTSVSRNKWVFCYWFQALKNLLC